MMKEKVLALLKGINPSIEEGIFLVKSGIIDSFEVVNIVMELEETFNVEIDPDDVTASNFETVDNIIELLERSSTGKENKK